MVRQLRQFPRVAENESVSPIKIRWASLSCKIILIVEYLLAKNRRAEIPESRRAETITCCVNRPGKSICRQELKFVTQSLTDRRLQRVVGGGSAALDMSQKRIQPEKRNSFGCIATELEVNPFTGFVGLAKIG